MTWELPPLHRHLSTVGIGPVFVCPPPHPLPPHPVEEAQQNGVSSDAPSSSPSNQSSKEIVTWEIVGNIKSTPEDFIVREIGWAPLHLSDVDENGDENDNGKEKSHDTKHSTNKYSRRPGWSRGIAGLEDEIQSKKRSDGMDVGSEERHVNQNETKELSEENIDADNDLTPTSFAKKARTEDIIELDHSTLDSHKSSAQLPPKAPMPPTLQSAALTPQNQNDEDLDANPMEGLRRILINCHWNVSGDGEDQALQEEREAAADALLQRLTDLQNLTLETINSKAASDVVDSDKTDGNRANMENTVWIPTAQLFKNSPEDWGLLHQHLRQAFPLLRSEASSVGPPGKGSEGDAIVSNAKDEDAGIKHQINSVSRSWVCALVDDTFFSIAPYLANPREDLLLLYNFRSNGPVPALGGEGNSRRDKPNYRNRGKMNKQKCGTGQEPKKSQQSDGDKKESNNSTQGLVLLRLRPDLPRTERRAIHQSLSSSRRREFDTSTKHDVSLDYTDKDSKQTTAVVVQWSRNAIQSSSQKKRKRTNGVANGSKRSSDITAIFCVLRKHQCEHQVAMKNVVHALRCRAGDVGLAGIKDMQAITYQYCTLRNVELNRAQRANHSLGSRVQLSNFVEVKGADALLDPGKLLGNRFEITLRDIKRVQRLQVEGEESWKEQTIPVNSTHLDSQVKRLNDFGFINFYGEQRVGDAGFRSRVGVRSFDVGRAMLQHDFSKAIDLIMAGRSSQVYSPGVEEINARKMWKDTGDARATLKAFPKNKNVMVRERDLVKGLLRYGDALGAVRCVPHNIRTFWIHGYQSYIWNRIASERIKMWGLRPVVGDLYINNSSDGEDSAGVQVVTDPETVHISQIVLPLPGYKMQYPSNAIGELYLRILRDDGVELCKDSIPEATAKGSYRKLIQRANNLKWDNVSEKEEDKSEASEDPVVKIARFTFELDSGCYATMMLRELMVTTMVRGCKSVGTWKL